MIDDASRDRGLVAGTQQEARIGQSTDLRFRASRDQERTRPDQDRPRKRRGHPCPSSFTQ